MFGSARVCDACPIPVWECVVWQCMTCAWEHFCFWWQCVTMCMLLSYGSMCVAHVTVLCQCMRACHCRVAACVLHVSLSCASMCKHVSVLWQCVCEHVTDLWQCVCEHVTPVAVCEQVTVLWQCVCEHVTVIWQCVWAGHCPIAVCVSMSLSCGSVSMSLSCGSMCELVSVLWQHVWAGLCPVAACVSTSLSCGSVSTSLSCGSVSMSLSCGIVCEQVTVLWQYVWAGHCPVAVCVNMSCVSSRGVQILVCFLHMATVCLYFSDWNGKQSCLSSDSRTNNVSFLKILYGCPFVVVVECACVCVTNPQLYVCWLPSQGFIQLGKTVFCHITHTCLFQSDTTLSSFLRVDTATRFLWLSTCHLNHVNCLAEFNGWLHTCVILLKKKCIQYAQLF